MISPLSALPAAGPAHPVPTPFAAMPQPQPSSMHIMPVAPAVAAIPPADATAHGAIFLLYRTETPLGQALLVTDEQGRLRALDWHDHEARMRQLMTRQYRSLAIRLRDTAEAPVAADALLRYFGGELHALDRLSVALGGTEFQRQVWHALRSIPAGHTLSYGELAKNIGRPAAVRAVGLANGANPVSLVLPCHRVIGSNSSLTGYGGGLHRKHWLLAHEHALPAASSAPPEQCSNRLPGL